MFHRFLLLFLLAALLAGCADNIVSVAVRKPPQLDLTGIQKIRLADFTVKGQTYTSGGELSFDSFMADIVVGDPTKPGEDELRQVQRSSLKQAFAQNGFFQVVEGSDRGVTLGGSVVYSVGDHISESKQYNAVTKQNDEVYTLTRNADVTIDFAVTAADGRVLAKSQVHTSSSFSVSSDSETAVRMHARNAKPLLLGAIATADQKLVCMLAPCTVTENRELRSHWFGNIGNGNKAAQNGAWDAAAADWRRSLVEDSPEDRLDALHNLGIYFEAKGKLPEAMDTYQQLFAKSGNPGDQADVERVKRMMRDEARVQQLLQAKNAGKGAASGKK